jgi:hypothetical protein
MGMTNLMGNPEMGCTDEGPGAHSTAPQDAAERLWQKLSDAQVEFPADRRPLLALIHAAFEEQREEEREACVDAVAAGVQQTGRLARAEAVNAIRARKDGTR